MGKVVTVTFVPEQVITWLIIGLIAGFAASVVLRGRGRDATTSIIIGLMGAIVGGFVFNVLGIQVSESLTGGFTLRYIDIIVAFVGALIILAIFGTLWRRRNYD